MLDDNDHAPVFSQSKYTFSVSEDARVDHSVGTVAATDDDVGNNAQISFSLNAENGSKCLSLLN